MPDPPIKCAQCKWWVKPRLPRYGPPGVCQHHDTPGDRWRPGTATCPRAEPRQETP